MTKTLPLSFLDNGIEKSFLSSLDPGKPMIIHPFFQFIPILIEVSFIMNLFEICFFEFEF